MRAVVFLLLCALSACVPPSLRYGRLDSVFGPTVRTQRDAELAVLPMAGGSVGVILNRHDILTAGPACAGAGDPCIVRSPVVLGYPMLLSGLWILPTMEGSREHIEAQDQPGRGMRTEAFFPGGRLWVRVVRGMPGHRSYWWNDGTVRLWHDSGALLGYGEVAGDIPPGSPLMYQGVMSGLAVGPGSRPGRTKVMWAYDLHRFLEAHGVDVMRRHDAGPPVDSGCALGCSQTSE